MILPSIWARVIFNSSTESTFSTSLIHNIASEGKSEQVVTKLSESYLPIHENDDGAREFIKWKFRYLLSLLSNHRTLWNIHKNERISWLTACLQMPTLGLCFPIRSSLSCNKCSCAYEHWNLTCSTWCRKLMNSSIRYLWWLECRTWISKNVLSVIQIGFHVSGGKHFSQLSIKRGLGIFAGWLGHVWKIFHYNSTLTSLHTVQNPPNNSFVSCNFLNL